MKFNSSQPGLITGLKYYKGTGDTGTHVGSLWASDGTLLASATFTNEYTSGWQYVTFDNPVAITAGTNYAVSYSSNGHYASTQSFFTTPYTNGILSTPGPEAGVYTYGAANLFPTSVSTANYWVDVLLDSPDVTGAIINGTDQAETLTGTGDDDIINGRGGDDTLDGGAGADALSGGAGADSLIGGAGNDTLVGGSGADILTGGLDADRFVFNVLADSGPGASDLITDFVHGTDIIDLSAIDADASSNGNQVFAFGGQNANVVASSVTWFESGENTVIQAEVSGDTTVDFIITLAGIDHNLSASDFIL